MSSVLLEVEINSWKCRMIFKLGTKVVVIKANAHKYSVSAMCRVLRIYRSTYY